jgi:DNA-binding transcriptional regulator GbsR (MarR family)
MAEGAQAQDAGLARGEAAEDAELAAEGEAAEDAGLAAEDAEPAADVAAGPDDALFGYIERFASVLVSAGFPPMPARVFVALLVTDSGRLSAAELAAMLRISPAAVSGAVRYLIQLGLVHKERVPGSRRDYYRMPGNMWDDMIRMRDQVMGRWTALVREGIDLVGADTPAGERMAEQAAFLEFATKELGQILSRWQEYQASEAGAAHRRGLAWRIWPAWRIWYPRGYQKLRVTRIFHAIGSESRPGLPPT